MSVEVTTSLRQVDDAESEPRWLLETSGDDDPDTTTEPPELARDDEELETLTDEEIEPPPAERSPHPRTPFAPR